MSNNGWTLERRARQAALIRTWKPWEKSTGPITDEGKAASSLNYLKGPRAHVRALMPAFKAAALFGDVGCLVELVCLVNSLSNKQTAPKPHSGLDAQAVRDDEAAT